LFTTNNHGKDKTSEERRIAICIFDDVAEHCGESSSQVRNPLPSQEKSSPSFFNSSGVLYKLSRIIIFLYLEWFWILNSLCCYRYYGSFLPCLPEACNDECSDVQEIPYLCYLSEVYKFSQSKN